VKGCFVIDCDFLARRDITQGDEQNMTVKNLHVGVRFARMIDVVCAVSTAAAVEAPTIINRTDAQSSPTRPAIRFGVCDLLARVLCDFPTTMEWGNSKTAFAFNSGFPD